MPKPNYAKAEKRILEFLETVSKQKQSSSESSKSIKGIQDVTLESSETAYQFTDQSLTVFSSPKNNVYLIDNRK